MIIAEMLPVTKVKYMDNVTSNMETKQISIDKAFDKLDNISYICHWHKLDIIDSYCDMLFGKIKQNFAYLFEPKGQKCQIENCQCDAEIKLIKRMSYRKELFA